MTPVPPLVGALARSDRLVEALELACELHGDQFRKGGEDIPYMSHLLEVCVLVIEDGVTRTRRSPRCSTTLSRTRGQTDPAPHPAELRRPGRRHR